MTSCFISLLRKGISKADLKDIKKKGEIVKDIENAIDDNLQRVGQTFAGIELVQFCKNELQNSYIKSLPFDRKFGDIVFWYFIVPIISKVTEHIGCQYLFLFAADSTDNQTLVNYYRSFLKFSDEKRHSAAIPLYDFTCQFMYQEIVNLARHRNDFLDNFNLGEEDV